MKYDLNINLKYKICKLTRKNRYNVRNLNFPVGKKCYVKSAQIYNDFYSLVFRIWTNTAITCIQISRIQFMHEKIQRRLNTVFEQLLRSL